VMHAVLTLFTVVTHQPRHADVAVSKVIKLSVTSCDDDDDDDGKVELIP